MSIKETITFELVKTRQRQRVYKASRVLRKKADGKVYRDKPEAAKFYRTAAREQHDLITRHLPHWFRYVTISDANTHIERLTFPTWDISRHARGEDHYLHLSDNIAGAMTFVSRGGDSRAVKPDEVYLRMLAKGNGYQFVKRENN